MWSEREALLRVARRRTSSEDEAEDTVSEAMLRAMQAQHLDDDRIGNWLTRVTINLCNDLWRDRARSVRRLGALAERPNDEASAEDRVIALDSATRVLRRLNALPSRQREALLLRAAGMDVNTVANELDVSYKTVESLLSRARSTLRGALGAVLPGLLVAARSARRGARSMVPAAASCGLAFVLLAPSGPPAAAVPDVQRVPMVVRTADDGARHGASDHARPSAPAVRRPAARPSAATVPPTRHRHHDAPPKAVQVVPARHLQSGPVGVQSGGITRHPSDKSGVALVRDCVMEGPALSPESIGCPP